MASKRGRKTFSSIFPKFGSSFFDLNMSLREAKTPWLRWTHLPLGLLEANLSHFLRQPVSPFKHPE